MRHLIYYVATTIDGFIAQEDGSFDCFLTEGEHFAYLLSEFPETVPSHLRDVLPVTDERRRFDTVLMGRNTYDVGRRVGVTSPYTHLRQIVVSRSLCEAPDPAVELVADDPAEVTRRLKREEGLDVWLCGGGVLASALASEIDELILKVNPVAIGAGVPLFAGGVGPTRLSLASTTPFANGVLINHYRVER